ncbi:MAG: hypothetical protein JKY70_02620 [Mucilaginibacter sp.]|nr:hypothetical protein [Mucilaginibacter sp.]
MKILFLATQWGAEHLAFEDFLIRAKTNGYDGIDTWVPESATERSHFFKLLNEYQLAVVCHQHQATGNNIEAFCRSYEYYLNLCMEWNPLLINSHSGKDFFSLEDKLKVIDTAQEFAAKNNIIVAHETHHGRIGYSPYESRDLFALRPEMQITADLSHWTCVTESYLENCGPILQDAITRAKHLHARVGFTEGPQVSDPRAREWETARNTFMNWWLQIIKVKKQQGTHTFTITPEFGPPPYMPTDPATGSPLSDQFSVNNWIKESIKKHCLVI